MLLRLGLPHLDGPGSFGFPGCCEVGGQYWVCDALLELEAELGGALVFAKTAPPLPTSTAAIATPTTRLDFTTPLPGARRCAFLKPPSA